MPTPFKTLEFNQAEPYTTIQLHVRVESKSLLKLYTISPEGVEMPISEDTWTINTFSGENTELHFLQDTPISNTLHIDIYPPEYLSNNIPLNIDTRKTMQSANIARELNSQRDGLRSVWSMYQNLDHHVKTKLTGNQEIDLLGQRLDALIQDFADFKTSHSQDITPNPDNPPTERIQNLLDRIQALKTQLDEEVTLSEQERADLVSLKAELEEKLPPHGTPLSPEHIKAIIDGLVERGQILDHGKAFKILDHAMQTRLARITLSDGSHRNSKSLLEGNTKPQMLTEEGKDLQPDPETLVPVIQSISLGQIGLVDEQDLQNRLLSGGIVSLTDHDRAILLKHDPSISSWLPLAEVILDHYVKNRILSVLYRITGHGKQTVMNLTEMYGDVDSKVFPAHLYGTYQSDKTIRQFNKDGSDKIEDGNYVLQKISFEGRLDGNQLAEIFKESTFGKNIISFMQANSQPKSHAEKALPINIVNTPGLAIKTETDASVVRNSYHHFYDMKPDWISLSDGLRVMATTTLGESQIEGTTTKTRLLGYITRIATAGNQEYIAHMSPEAVAAETNVTGANNIALQQDYHKQESIKKLDVLNFLSGTPHTYRYQTADERIEFISDMVAHLISWLRHSVINEDHQVKSLRNPQILGEDLASPPHPVSQAERYETTSAQIDELIEETVAVPSVPSTSK